MRRRSPRTLMLLIAALSLAAPIAAPVEAASGFADLAFEQQWRAGEALAPNFWGPLATARDGQQEPYDGKMRLVQYFDKGRMELRGDGTVTNGLLASEIVRGQIQTGDATFQDKAPPAIPLAGDLTNPGPTYAQLKAHADQFLIPVSSRLTSPTQGEPITVMFGVTGDVVPFMEGANYPPADISLYDDATMHNVPRAFASYRQRVGLATVGLAISEAFWSNPKVGGKNLLVLVQVFERRVLTYTPTNDAAFQIEMGNIGQHYSQWRYGTAPASVTPAVAQSSASDMGQVVADPAGTFRVTLPPGWRGPSARSTSPKLTLTGPNATVLTIESKPTNVTTLPDDPVALLRTASSNLVIGNGSTVSGSFDVVIGNGVTFTTPVDTMVGGAQGKQFAFTVQSKTPIYGQVSVALHSGQAYVFIGVSPDPGHADVDAITNSLVFTP